MFELPRLGDLSSMLVLRSFRNFRGSWDFEGSGRKLEGLELGCASEVV